MGTEARTFEHQYTLERMSTNSTEGTRSSAVRLFAAPSPFWAAALAFCLTLIIYLSTRTRLKRGVSLPPGPKRRWVIGNLHQLAKVQMEPWRTFEQWSKVYGPVMYLEALKQKTLILSSATAARDLLESRATIYSDRPTLWMTGELGGRKDTIFLLSSSNPRFKLMRRMFHSGLGPRATKDYGPILTHQTSVLLRGLLDAPEEFAAHSRRFAVASILKVAYGYSVEATDDPMSKIMDESDVVLADISTQGKYLVEFLPFLRFVPEWVPGAGFKKVAREAATIMSRIEWVPFEWAKEDISTGNHVESFTSKHLKDATGNLADNETQDLLKWASAGLYGGGSDTTRSALISFFFLMTMHPEVQHRAQTELDQIAPNRLPTMDDYDHLPYIRAIIKETLRWGPVVPLGLPHRLTEDDVYQNFITPKGTTVMANIWAITHDEELYPNSHVFDPERHLGQTPQPDPLKLVFGFGRRVCPGAHFAETSLFLTMSNILSVFKIAKDLDENGIEIVPEIGWTTSFVTHLKPFRCQIKPRSAGHLVYLDKQ